MGQLGRAMSQFVARLACRRASRGSLDFGDFDLVYEERRAAEVALAPNTYERRTSFGVTSI